MITDGKDRKQFPITRGCLDYFPNALLAVANCSYVCNEQHNSGEDMHWEKTKSTDEADALVRHLLQRGTHDTDGIPHSAKVAWRALALLERELSAQQLPVSTPSASSRPSAGLYVRPTYLSAYPPACTSTTPPTHPEPTSAGK